MVQRHTAWSTGRVLGQNISGELWSDTAWSTGGELGQNIPRELWTDTVWSTGGILAGRVLDLTTTGVLVSGITGVEKTDQGPQHSRPV